METKLIGQRITVVRGDMSKAAFARELGVEPSYIGMLESGKSTPSKTLIELMALKFNFYKEWIATGAGPDIIIKKPDGTRIYAEEPAIYNEGLINIKQVTGEISAGGGLIPDETGEVTFCFRKDWIERKGDWKNMSVTRVKGDSMEPTLLSGDIILIDHSKNYVDPHGGIYAIALEHEIMVKRIQVLYPSKKLRVISDNSRYEPAEIDPGQVIINGKVIWFGREIER